MSGAPKDDTRRNLTIIGIILAVLILMISLVVLIDPELRAAFMQVQKDQHEDMIETESSQESLNVLDLRQNPVPESSHSESDPSVVRVSNEVPDDNGTVGVWWRDAGALSGKLRIKQVGAKLTENWTFMNGQTMTRKLVESKEAGLRRFDIPESAPHNEYYILQEDGWLRLGGPNGVFQVIPPDSLNIPKSAPPNPQAYSPARGHSSCDGLKHLDPWNGESPELNRAVQLRLNDPNSLEVLETKIGENESGRHLITMEFTARTPFGGRKRMRAVGWLDHDTKDVELTFLR